MQFFKTAFTDASFNSIHTKLLEAFQKILIRCIANKQEDKALEIFNQNKDAILKLLNSKSLQLNRTAISILSLRPNMDLLKHLYEIIENESNENYKYLSGIIIESLQSHLKKYEAEIKRKLFEIATTNTNTDIQERTINLLSELSEIRDTIYTYN